MCKRARPAVAGIDERGLTRYILFHAVPCSFKIRFEVLCAGFARQESLAGACTADGVMYACMQGSETIAEQTQQSI